MDPGDYRRDYAAYRSAVEHERFRHHSGLSQKINLLPFEDRYADLWTRAAIDDLSRYHAEAPTQFETQCAGLRALIGAAQILYAELSSREVAEELKRCEESARVEWGGAGVAGADAPDMIAVESDAARRRELAARWLDAVRSCDDLRAARLEALDSATRSLGFDGRHALYESFTGVDLGKLAGAADLFLERTEAAYMSQLSRWAAREMPPNASRELRYADQLFFVGASRFDSYFPARDFRALYGETLAGIGVRVEAQRNLQIDAEHRPSKGVRSACFAVNPPEDVRLVVGASAGGVGFYRQTFEEGGRAQVYAWASKETASRHPEFVYAPDSATVRGHALLLSGLFRDAAWLGRHRGLRETEARETARHVALLELHEARRECASLRYALTLALAGDVRAEHLAETYASLCGGATGFRYDTATRLLDADEHFHSATRLRARLFATGMREHLRARHGWRWYASRGAGDELIDIWNTASRYAVEELARLVWGGELSFDLLADVLMAAADGGDDT